MANMVTGCRIVCSILLLFVPAFSRRFVLLYLACGFTDMIDGTIARKTNTASGFGARLDTAADLLCTGVCLVRLLPAVQVPGWVWIWTAVIAVIKAVNIISGFLYLKRFPAEHTAANKITGLLLFLLPLTLPFAEVTYSAAVVCCAATFAAVQEGHFIRTGREIT